MKEMIKQNRPMAMIRILYAVAILILTSPLHSSAGVILGEMDWSDGAEGWSSSYTTLNEADQEWLTITFPETVQPEGGDEWNDLIYVQAEDLFAGSWPSEGGFVEFDFWAEDEVPAEIQIQWSSETNSEVWSQSLTQPSSTQEWTTYEVGLGDWEDWMYSGAASEDQYLSDLSTIDWIGIYIEREGPGGQMYGLDNFKLVVPEPAEMILLGSALVASAMSLKKRRKRRQDDG